MKNYCLLFVLNLTVLTGNFGQGKSVEVSPEFFIAQGEFITEVISVDFSEVRYDFLTMSCYHFDVVEIPIFFRLKRGEAWTDWVKLEQQHEFVAPDRSSYIAKPIKKSFSAIQLKAAKDVRSSLTLRFFLAGSWDYQVPTIGKSLNCELPTVCERDCWCPTCPIDDTPEFTEPTHLIVHHSAAHNDSDNYALVVESIWDFHVNTNGWDDIGYNWLIDPDGVLYAGRPDNYQGAHFSCINENTVGICVLGDFTLISPSDEAIFTLVNLLGYEATEHNIDIEGESYHETGEFDLTNLAGHRDSSGSLNACSGTVCPGDEFYPLLPEIRLLVADLPCYNESVSTSDQAYDLEIVLYPNPTKNYLFVSAKGNKKLQFELVNMKGQMISDIQSGEINDLGHLDSGLYFLMFEGKVIDKLVKQ